MECICKECDYKISGLTIQIVKKNLKKHLKLHNISYEDYVVKNDYNNIKPVCFCGCGEYTNFFHGRFFKYVGDHKNHITGVYKNPKKELLKEEKIEEIKCKLRSVNLSIDDLFGLYKDLCEFRKSLNIISSESGIDKRTIKNYWNIFGFIKSEEDFRRLIKKHQTYWMTQSALKKQKIDEGLLLDVYLFLENNKNIFTINEIKDKFEIGFSGLVIYKRLCDKFGEEKTKSLIKSGISSRPETEFFNAMKYFFGDKIKKQFRLEGKVYDMILSDNILIEFDGNYWHSIPRAVKNDKIKNEIAKRNKFTLIRIKDSESKDINILKKIIEIYEDKSNRS